MNQLLILALAGFAAQLVDGALGMGYGVTSTTMLLTLGLTPSVVSASVHAGEVVTTLVSGLSHWRFGNVDVEMAWRLAIPGAVGAFLGALFLTSLPVHLARPAISVFLFFLGTVVLFRFARLGRKPVRTAEPVRQKKLLAPLGFIAGFLDATGGGGWGPISTSTLIARPQSDARRVIGSVDASEFLVALSATIGFALALGWEGINFIWVAAIVVGGIFAAPLAAWAVRSLPTDVLGVSVGVMIMFSNARTVLDAFGVEVPLALFFGVVAVPPIAAFALPRLRRARQARPAS